MSLLKSRAFWTAVLALLQTIVLSYVGVPQEIWVAIDAILVIVITHFTIDDVAKIRAEAEIKIAQINAESEERIAMAYVNANEQAFKMSYENNDDFLAVG